MAPVCVVCANPADVYCHNDDANLCFACDHTVHSAHVVANKHHRTPIGDCSPQNDSLDEHFAVPQQASPLDKQERMDTLDLSFSDDGWFTVPDTACSTARGPTKASKAKSFELDDLFGFDAAIDEEVAFALDPASDDLLADCLVPVEPEPLRELPKPCAPSVKFDNSVPAIEQPKVHECPATVPAAAPAPPPPAQAPTVAYTYPAVCDAVPNVDNYIPHSLIPVDAVSRSAALAERREKVLRFREKKKNRQFKKLIRYASRKRYAEVRPRIKGRFARKDEIAAAKAAGVPLEC